MIWVLIFLLTLTQSSASSVTEVANKSYLVTSAFGGDILDARYRIDLVEELKKGEYCGVIFTDYNTEQHLERLKYLDINGDLDIEELRRIGERIFLTFTSELYKQGFDVATLGEEGITFAERGLVSFCLVANKVVYSENLWYLLPLENLPHLDWDGAFRKEVSYLKDIARKNMDDPFYKLSYFSLQSLLEDPEDQILSFRLSLEKAGLKGSPIDNGWQRLEEIYLQIKRQKLKSK